MDSTRASIFNDRGWTYFRLRDYERSLSDFAKALQLEPTMIRARHNRAAVQAHLGKYDEAISDYEYLIQIYPTHPVSYLNRGFTYIEQKKYDSAFADFNFVIENLPDYHRGHYAKAYLYSVLDLRDSAIACYTKAIETLYNRIHETRTLTGDKFVRKGVREYAEDRLEDFEWLMASYYAGRAKQHRALQQSDYVVADYTNGLRWDSTSSTILTDLGWEYYLRGDMQQCLALSEKAMVYNPKSITARYNRALALLRLNRIGEAHEAYRKTLDYSNLLLDRSNYNRQATSPQEKPTPEAEEVISAREGAIGDLRDLLAKNIQTAEVQAILRDLFGVRE